MCGACTWERGLNLIKVRLDACAQAKGVVIVIDVLRAFTTTAYAFAAGAEKIIATASVEEAFALKKRFPDALLAGEVAGMPIEGFDFDNSPVHMQSADLRGKTLILRTSSGTQGVARSKRAGRLLVSSFVVAEATARRIRKLNPYQFTCVITGQKRGGFEDEALADYLGDKFAHHSVDPQIYLTRVKESPLGKLFTSGEVPHFSQTDLYACCELDRFDFAMEVFQEEGLQVIRPVNELGEVLIQ